MRRAFEAVRWATRKHEMGQTIALRFVAARSDHVGSEACHTAESFAPSVTFSAWTNGLRGGSCRTRVLLVEPRSEFDDDAIGRAGPCTDLAG